MSLMDLGSTVDSFATGTYSVLHRKAAERIDGIDQPPEESAELVRGCVQNLSGREVQRLPEGIRQRELRAFFCRTILRAGGPNWLPDRVRIGPHDWEVATVDDWRQLGGFVRAVVMKLDAGVVEESTDSEASILDGEGSGEEVA